MPFRPPPASLHDSVGSASKAWSFPQNDPPPAAPAGSLSADDAAIADQYRKMLEMGMTEGAVRRKMSVYGVDQVIVDAVFPPEEEEPPTEAAETGTTLTDEEEEIALKYRKMLQMGMPEGAVAQKMSTDEVPQHIQKSVLPPDEPASGGKDGVGKSDDTSLTEEDKEMITKYRKMFSMGMPEGAVIQKMSVDEAPKHVQDAVLAQQEEKTADEEVKDEVVATSTGLTEEEEAMRMKYKKMFAMGMPEGAVIQKMSVDEVPKHVQDAVLAQEETENAADEGGSDAVVVTSTGLTAEEEEMKIKYKKMIAMGMPDGAVMQKMAVDEVPKHVQDAVLAPEEQEGDKSPTKEVAETNSVLTEDEEEMKIKYKKMLATGIPEGAVMQKMETDDVPKHVQDAVLAPADQVDENPPKDNEETNAVLTDKDEQIKDQNKMFPVGASEELATADEVPAKVQETTLSRDGAQVRKDEDTTTAAILESAGKDPEPDPSAAPHQDDASAEYVDDEIIDEEIEFEYIDEEEEHDPDDSPFDQAARSSIHASDERKLESAHDGSDRNGDNIQSFDDEEFDEGSFEREPSHQDSQSDVHVEDFEDEPILDQRAAISRSVERDDVETTTQVFVNEEYIENHPDEETGFEKSGTPPPDDLQISQSRPVTSAEDRKTYVKTHPDRTFHRLVFLAYVLMIGGGVAVCLVFLLDDGNSSESTSGMRTTIMDPINGDSCDFSNSVMPNVIDQCRCDGEIATIPYDVQQRYQRHLEKFIPLLYDNYEEPISSCSDRNQALVWLSTGNDYKFSEVARSERFSLATLFIATKGEMWTDSQNWLSELSVCDWFGILCTQDSVNSVDLTANNAAGTIPYEIYILQELSTVSFSQNNIGGEIPQEVFFLPNLSGLFLSENQLSGAIPDSLQEAVVLQELDLRSNTLEGTIPERLDQATSLVFLDIAENNLKGRLTSSLFKLPKLGHLRLNENQLDGTIPSMLSTASSLKMLNLSSNLLVGSLPPALGDITSLERLALRDLDLEGSIPTTFGKLSNLLELVISETGIEGSIPTSLGKISDLQILDLSSNGLGGAIPANIGRLTNLGSLNLSNNFLSGSIPSELGKLTALADCLLNDNNLSGDIPTTLGLLEEMESLRLDGNIIQGTVPSSVCDLREAKLDNLIVDCSSVACEVPECCTECRP